MIQFFATEFYDALNELRWDLELLGQLDQEKHIKRLIRHVEAIERHSEVLELTGTKGRCERFKRSLELTISPLVLGESRISLKTVTAEEARSEIEGIQDAVSKEMKPRRFVFVPVTKMQFFEQDELFGDAVHAAFLSAKTDIKDAGNCLAVDLNTAAVFHLMRTVEFGLRAFARHLKIKVGPPLEYAMWGKIIQAIETKLKTIGAFLNQ